MIRFNIIYYKQKKVIDNIKKKYYLNLFKENEIKIDNSYIFAFIFSSLIIVTLFFIPVKTNKIKKVKVADINAHNFFITKFVHKNYTKNSLEKNEKRKKNELLNAIDEKMPDSKKSSVEKNENANAGISTINYKPDFKIDKIPLYPTAAKRTGQQGVAYIVIKTDKSGNITNIYIEKSSGYTLLDDAAINAVKEWDFKKVVNHSSEEYIIKTSISFRLTE